MPFYEYQCEACEHQLEALQKISDAPLVYCPECGEASLKKMVSRSAFRLKGTGWYETDFKGGKDKGKDSKAEGEGGGKSSDSGEAPAKEKKADSGGNSTSEPAKKTA